MAPPPTPPSTRSTLEPVATLSPTTLSGSPAWAASFSIDGKYLAACFGNPHTCIKVWEHRPPPLNIGGGKKGGKRSDKDGNKGNAIATIEEEGEQNSGAEWALIATIREEHTRTVRSVAFAPTSSTLGVPILATASFDGKVLIWEHYPDDANNATEGENAIEGSDNPYFEPIAQLEGHENEVKCLAWNATGSLLASCGRDKTVWVWECFLPGTVGGSETPSNDPMFVDPNRRGGEQDQGEFECLAVLQGHDGDVKSICFGPSHGQWGEGEEVLFSASYDNTVKVWAEESGDWYCAATLGADAVPQSMPNADDELAVSKGPVHASTVWCLGLAPSGVRLFSGSEDGSVAIWRMYTAAERRRLFPRAANRSSTDGLWNCVGKLPDAHSGYAVLDVDCAPARAGHGRIASGGGDNGINIYREETAEGSGGSSDTPKFAMEAMVVEAHEGDVNCVRWHPRDGTCLVSCGDDGAVKLWKYRRG